MDNLQRSIDLKQGTEKSSFNPVISNRSRSLLKGSNYRPIHKRYNEVTKNKEDKLKRLEDQIYRKNEKKQNRDSIYRDFYKESVEWLKRKDNKITVAKEKASFLASEANTDVYTFRPTINNSSRKLLDSSFEERLKKSVERRLQIRSGLSNSTMFKQNSPLNQEVWNKNKVAKDNRKSSSSAAKRWR